MITKESIVKKLSDIKNFIWFNPQRNLILIIIGSLILAPISFVVSKEAANKFYSRLYDRQKIQVSSKVQESTANSSPETSSTNQPNTGSTTTSGSSNNSSTNSGSNNGSGNGSGNNSNNSGSSNNGSGSGSSGSSTDSSSDLPSCGSNYSFFTTSPLNESDFKGLTPLGNLNPSSHVFPTDHIYFYLTNSLARYNLYAPGDATITQINASEHVEDGFTDYSFTFQPCNEFKAQFGHVSALASKLSQALTAPYSWESTYSTGGKTYHMYGKMVDITISAGEQIGTVGGNSGQYALDMNAYDTRVTLSFANPARWTQRSDTTHTVCPVNYYSGDLKNTLINRFGDYDGDPKRTTAPICGTIEQDIAETAQGVWFLSGTSNSWSGEDAHLALAHDNVDPTKAVFSVGTSMSASGLSSSTYQFSPQGSGLVNRDFDDITSDGNIYCSEPNYLTGKIILQLTNSTTLKIERQDNSCGSGPWSFTSNAATFER